MGRSVAAALASGSNVAAHEGIPKSRDHLVLQLGCGATAFRDGEHIHGAIASAGVRVLLPPMSRVVCDSQIEVAAPGYRPNLRHTMLAILSEIPRFITRKT